MSLDTEQGSSMQNRQPGPAGLRREPDTVATELGMHVLASRLWAGKWKILAGAAAFAVSAVAFALWQPNVYYAKVLLAPADTKEGGLESLLGQFGSLASLAGIQARGDRVDKAIIAIETLRSRLFITRFIRDHQLLVPLFAARGWDRRTRMLVIDSDIYDVASSRWVRRVSAGRSVVPSDEEAYKEFSNLLFISQDKKTGLVTVGVDALSPSLAKQWVDALIHDVNETIRRTDMEEAERSIVYLQKQLALTQVADIQKVFYNLIEQQTKTMMLTQVRLEYAFKTIDPATEPERKAKPARALISIFGTLFGAMAGMFWVLLTEPARRISAVPG